MTAMNDHPYEMCGQPGCLHFVEPNDSDEAEFAEFAAAGIPLAGFVHLDDGEKDHDHDAIQGGGIRTLAEWRTTRPELFAEYADGKIGPNSALCTPGGTS